MAEPGQPGPAPRRASRVLAVGFGVLVVVSAACGPLGGGAQAGDAGPPAPFTGRCVGVKDGDSIVVLHGGREEQVRLDGVDCPELGQGFGQRAKQHAASLVVGREVEVRPTTLDRYGRTVARVGVGGVDLSLALVEAGLAWHFTLYSTDPALAAAEVEARRAARGLWVDDRAVAPWVFRRERRERPEGAEAPAVAADEPFHGNTSSRVFHSAACPQFDCEHCTAAFATREAALAAGYRPCGICGP